GVTSLDATVAGSVAPGELVTGTITNSGGRPDGSFGLLTTSDFASCLIAGEADLSVTLADSPDPVARGQLLTYTATVTNAGPDPAAAARLALTLPDNATFASATASIGSCSGMRGSAECALGTLAAGTSATVTVKIYPLEAGTVGASARATAAIADPDAADATAATTTTVEDGELTPTTYTVDSVADGADIDLGDGSCADAAGACTLRAALAQANASPGADTIAFAIAGAGVHTIAPASALPQVTDPVTIDATSQPGYAGTPLVELNGQNALGAAGAQVDGLLVSAGQTSVRGLALNRFSGWQLHLKSNGGDTLAANVIGTSANGETIPSAASSSAKGIWVENVAATIGGSGGFSASGAVCAADCNLISPGYNAVGSGIGIQVSGANASGTVIAGNFLGTTRGGERFAFVSGIGERRGVSVGILVQDTSGVTIGGTSLFARNLISNAAFQAIRLENAQETTIQGNWLGLNAAGTQALPSTDGALYVGPSSSGTLLGGPTLVTGAPPGNVVASAAPSNATMNLQGPQTTLEGNLIGTNPGGSLALANPSVAAMTISGAGTRIGGADPLARNVIAGHASGITFLGPATTAAVAPLLVENNYIGTNADGSGALGNGSGISLLGSFAKGATIRANLISGQLQDGIVLDGGDFATIVGNRIGTSASGAALGNGRHGISAPSGGFNTVGGSDPGTANTIAYNGGDGVNGRSGLLLLGNSIHDNAGRGISYQLAGFVQGNYLTLNSAAPLAGGGTRVQGSLAGSGLSAGASYRIELFANSACDPSGAGEGERFLGATSVTAGTGVTSLDATVAGSVAPGELVTGTITNSGGRPDGSFGLLTTSDFA
ncbi:MAG TPA: right-handed parallel beta-helix repeat-containing protein, partial [Geminicoccaceae bacterium]|nr:right-handed parallel beta-helix repeat-containing protein [Geminicoccaceae bacterium]